MPAVSGKLLAGQILAQMIEIAIYDAPCGPVVVGPVARCRSGPRPPAAPASPQQTHASRAGPGGGGKVHRLGRPAIATDSVEARRQYQR